MNPEQIVRALLEDDGFDARSYFLDPRWHEVWQVMPREIRRWVHSEPERDPAQRFKVVQLYRRKHGALSVRLRGARPTTYDDAQKWRYKLQSYLDSRFGVSGQGSPFYVWAREFPDSNEIDIDVMKSMPEDTDKYGDEPHPYA